MTVVSDWCSTSCLETIFKVTWLWRWLLLRLSKHQSPTTVLVRVPFRPVQVMWSDSEDGFGIQVVETPVANNTESFSGLHSPSKMIIFNYGILLPASNHFLICVILHCAGTDGNYIWNFCLFACDNCNPRWEDQHYCKNFKIQWKKIIFSWTQKYHQVIFERRNGFSICCRLY